MRTPSPALKYLICIVGTLAVGSLSGLATASSIETWYATLEKPSFNPPNWIFGPVWTLLYVLMGIAAGLVWNARHDQGQVRSALRLYIIQLVLNATWSLVFFSRDHQQVRWSTSYSCSSPSYSAFGPSGWCSRGQPTYSIRTSRG